ncbi:unnamed protein product [Calypogeia fissa]
MASMTMHMPSMPPGVGPSPALRPGSPGHNYQHQAHSNANHLQSISASGQGGSAVSQLSLALPLSNPQGPPPQNNNAASNNSPLANSAGMGTPLDSSVGLQRVKLIDMLPEDGAPSGMYTRTVETLSNSLARYNAVIIELGGEDATLVRCALESAKLYFRSRGSSGGAVTNWGGTDLTKSTGYISAPSRELYLYRAGRSSYEDIEPPPPGMPEVFRCLGKTSRASLSAIARHLRLRSDAFASILDDSPLPSGETSSSVLTATSFHHAGGGGKSMMASDSGNEVEKGLLMLVAADTPGLRVCDPNGNWFLADNTVGPGDLILLTGRALQQATAGLRKASPYRVVPLSQNGPTGSTGRTSLAFRLMPRSNATIDSAPVANAGHSVPDGYGTISVAAFMDGLTAAEALTSNGFEHSVEALNATSTEPSLRSVLSDPISGALLEDAMVGPCGHSSGGETLKRVYDTNLCSSCGIVLEVRSLIPNLALREAALAYRREAQNRMLQGARAAKRRKEPSEQADPSRHKRPKQDNPNSPSDKETVPRSGTGGKGVQYPFSVNERVMIKGNKRTPEKFVGREAHITSQCLNGWYLLKTLDNGESVRLQYRSLQKSGGDHNGVSEDHATQGNQ